MMHLEIFHRLTQHKAARLLARHQDFAMRCRRTTRSAHPSPVARKNRGNKRTSRCRALMVEKLSTGVTLHTKVAKRHPQKLRARERNRTFQQFGILHASQAQKWNPPTGVIIPIATRAKSKPVPSHLHKEPSASQIANRFVSSRRKEALREKRRWEQETVTTWKWRHGLRNWEGFLRCWLLPTYWRLVLLVGSLL